MGILDYNDKIGKLRKRGLLQVLNRHLLLVTGTLHDARGRFDAAKSLQIGY